MRVAWNGPTAHAYGLYFNVVYVLNLTKYLFSYLLEFYLLKFIWLFYFWRPIIYESYFQNLYKNNISQWEENTTISNFIIVLSNFFFDWLLLLKQLNFNGPSIFIYYSFIPCFRITLLRVGCISVPKIIEIAKLMT